MSAIKWKMCGVFGLRSVATTRPRYFLKLFRAFRESFDMIIRLASYFTTSPTRMGRFHKVGHTLPDHP